jgi:hypothetical protein
MAISKIVPQSTGFGDANVSLQIPNISLENRSASAANGSIIFNTSNNEVEVFSNGEWSSVSTKAPTIVSVSDMYGFNGAGVVNTTIDIVGTSFGTQDVVVKFSGGGVDTTVTVTPNTTTSINDVNVPTTIMTQAGGNVIAVSVTSSAGLSSGTVSKTLIGAATGGTISAFENYRYHKFTSSSNLIVPSGFSITGQALVVAGGASGGSRSGDFGLQGGGGGGAGGVVFAPSLSLTVGTYVVTVGAGGSAASGSVTGTNGGNSGITGVPTTAVGGGGGGAYATGNGVAGGSGGGGGRDTNSVGGSGTPGQGNPGGTGSSPTGAGGGGGAGAAGTNGGPAGGKAGPGGVGTSAYSVWGQATSSGQESGGTYYFAGGGGGAGYLGGQPAPVQRGLGGLGGGGNGGIEAVDAGTSGSVNTGGGGGADSDGILSGGSGIVIVRYTFV